MRDHFLVIFGSCSGGSPTANIELPLTREPHFHFFTKFDFSSILGSILESFWGPSSQLYSFLGAQRVSKKVFERNMKKRYEKSPASDASDATNWRGGPLLSIKNLQNADCRPADPEPPGLADRTGIGNHSTACQAARWQIKMFGYIVT